MEQTLIFFFLNMSCNIKRLEAVGTIDVFPDDDDDDNDDDDNEEKEDLPKCSQWVRSWMSKRKTNGAFY